MLGYTCVGMAAGNDRLQGRTLEPQATHLNLSPSEQLLIPDFLGFTVCLSATVAGVDSRLGAGLSVLLADKGAHACIHSAHVPAEPHVHVHTRAAGPAAAEPPSVWPASSTCTRLAAPMRPSTRPFRRGAAC